MPISTILHNATVVTVGGGAGPKLGAAMRDLGVKEATSIAVDADGKIAGIFAAAELEAYVKEADAGSAQVIDCNGKVIFPGFVDAHTHAVFDGDRSHEMALKLAGATYLDIYKAGGGIQFTVRKTNESSVERLEELLSERLDRMLAGGTTTVEIKSGYGLSGEGEAKMLKVIRNVNVKHPVTCVATYCGAHAVPPGSTAADHTHDIIENQLPMLHRLIEAGEIDPAFIDVFCEKGFFDADMTRRILVAGREIGLHANFHGDELTPMGSGELAADIGARAVAHLEHVSPDGITAMAAKGVTAVLLPTTAYVLRLTPPPARALIDAGVPVALGSDFNPNAWCLTMPLVMNIACVQMRMTMEEAVVAATINSAAALGVGASVGSVEVGKLADLVVFDVPKWEHVIYQMDGPPVHAVYKAGKLVSGRSYDHK